MIIVLIVALAAGLLVYQDYQKKQVGHWETAVNIGNVEVSGITEKNKAPAFILPNLDGEDVSLADLEGKVVLLSFWTTWCPYCKADMPGMDSIYIKYKEDGFMVLAINVTALERTPNAVRNFINESGYVFPVLLDVAGDVSEKYNVQALPTSFLISKNGEIVHSRVGSFTSQEMEALISKLL